MKLKVGFLLLLCPFFGVHAQDKITSHTTFSGLQPLQTGGIIPDIQLAKVLNNNGKTLRLSDFYGKLLILDFWATSCGACIEAMPRLDSLQQLFGSQIAILPVSGEKEERVRHFQKTNGFLQGLKFRTVVEDQALHALFPHRLLPHEVWIDGMGTVLGYTEVEAVNAFNIKSALAGKGITAPAKADVLDYDSSKPLLVSNNGGADTGYSYRSIITGKLNGLQSSVSIGYDSLKRRTVIRATNITARRLYTLVYKGLRALQEDQVILGPAKGLFCYELDLPGSSPARVRQSIREDLDRFFNVRSEFTGSAFRLLPVTGTDDKNEPLTL